MKEVFGIGKIIFQYCELSDANIKSMTTRMKEKYKKCWGNDNDINMLLSIVLTLDHRHKLECVNWFIDYSFDLNKAIGLCATLVASLNSL